MGEASRADTGDLTGGNLFSIELESKVLKCILCKLLIDLYTLEVYQSIYSLLELGLLTWGNPAPVVGLPRIPLRGLLYLLRSRWEDGDSSFILLSLLSAYNSWSYSNISMSCLFCHLLLWSGSVPW